MGYRFDAGEPPHAEAVHSSRRHLLRVRDHDAVTGMWASTDASTLEHEHGWLEGCDREGPPAPLGRIGAAPGAFLGSYAETVICVPPWPRAR